MRCAGVLLIVSLALSGLKGSGQAPGLLDGNCFIRIAMEDPDGHVLDFQRESCEWVPVRYP